ncbi:MAG: hypothetical protein ACHQQ3_14640, partial [Gemmatimonadales bacterium]
KLRAAPPAVAPPVTVPPPGVTFRNMAPTGVLSQAWADSLRKALSGSGYTTVSIDSIIRATRDAQVMMRFGNPGAGRGRDGPTSAAAFAERAANMGPPRRIVVWNHPPERLPGIQEAGTSIMDLLRKSLDTKRYVQVNRDSTLAVLDRTRNRDSVMQALSADLMVSIRGTSVRTDSIYWMVTVRDMSANSSYTQRTVVSPRVPMATPLLSVDSLVSQSVHAIEELDRAPRRRPDDGRGRPPGAIPPAEPPAAPVSSPWP